MRLTLLLLFFISVDSYGQNLLKGIVTNENSEVIVGASIQELLTNRGTKSNEQGYFELEISSGEDSVALEISHVAHVSQKLVVSSATDYIEIVLVSSTEYLDEVSIRAEKDLDKTLIKIDPKNADALITPFREFNKILATLPGVASNNELSSAYSVRGGNFDENVVYVNDIPIYRPFLVSNGQQEGLSFINSDLVSSVEFSAGGWQSKYGDKLSSVLNVTYKKPTEFAASASISLLGGSFHAEGVAKKDRINYGFGFRHKSSQYLLNTLEVDGQYLPRFSDFQSIVNFNLGNENDKKRTQLSVLTSYARNRYFIEPASRETEFGNFSQSLRLFVAFDGQEVLEYDTYQIGTKLTHQFSDKIKSQLVAAGVYATEREYTDVEGSYRLCDVDKNISSSTFNDCVFTRGVGTNYDFGRNNLTAEILNIENRTEILLNDNATKVEFGLGYSRQLIDDQLQEYDFTDSALFVTEINAVQSAADLASNQWTGCAQSTFQLGATITSTFGVRANYWSLNEELLISPRWQMQYVPSWKRDLSFTAAIGVYQQPPFYREMRAFDGTVNTSLLAQKSIHFVLGMDYYITLWQRPFLLSTEAYYKNFRDVVPYEVENVKVRYYATNSAEAFATGLDFRISGEFIEGAESWFSLGILNVQEDVENDGNGYIRRPTDQLINASIFFQDHFPNNPDIRVNVNLLYGSGLPFGPPQDFENRNSFRGGAFTRLDIGFSRVIYLNKEKNEGKKQLILSAEVLNLFGTDNPISYTWISDVNNDQYAVPNSLSARFLNVRATIRI